MGLVRVVVRVPDPTLTTVTVPILSHKPNGGQGGQGVARACARGDRYSYWVWENRRVHPVHPDQTPQPIVLHKKTLDAVISVVTLTTLTKMANSVQNATKKRMEVFLQPKRELPCGDGVQASVTEQGGAA
jgi:hypothetical protein